MAEEGEGEEESICPRGAPGGFIAQMVELLFGGIFGRRKTPETETFRDPGYFGAFVGATVSQFGQF